MRRPLKHALGGLPVALLAVGAFVWYATVEAEPAHGDDPFLRRTATVRAVELVGPAVVNITTERIVSRSPFGQPGQRTGDPFFDRFFNDFFESHSRLESVQSLGSGVVIDSDLHVLTNEHVVSRASRIRVSLADGREFDASLVGADPKNDLAVLMIATDEEVPWVAPGTSSDLLVGEPVIAIGNPFGLSSTVTTGVVSAINRSFRAGQRRTFHGFLQTDASINPGNSGGPLLNALGNLIGINTAIYGDAEGIGFAIPIDTAKRVAKQLIEYGELQPPWVGFTFQSLDGPLHDVLELPEGVTGVLVNAVWEDGPAERAGLRRGDIITRVDGRPLQTAVGLYEMLEPTTTGQKLQLEVWRDGKQQSAVVEVRELPKRVAGQLVEHRLGMRLQSARGIGFDVASVATNGEAARIGIRAGDRILAINGRALEDDHDLGRALRDLGLRLQAALVVERQGKRYNVTLPLR